MKKLDATKIQNYLDKTKSSSGVNGPELAEAHLKLGYELGKQMELSPDTTIVAILRGGIFFATGIYLATNCKFMLFDPKREKYSRPDTKNVLLVDTVINTGKTIKEIYSPGTQIACIVINEKAINFFEKDLICWRVSKNSFVGKEIKVQNGNIGPDTTSRLFNTIPT